MTCSCSEDRDCPAGEQASQVSGAHGLKGDQERHSSKKSFCTRGFSFIQWEWPDTLIMESLPMGAKKRGLSCEGSLFPVFVQF